jgi:hypothetical protein
MSTVNTPLPACITRDRLTSPYWPNLSFAGLAAVAALGLIFMLTSFNRLNHTDLWGHLNFGRWIVAHEALPATDPFAAGLSATHVLQGAWLAQAIGYEAQRLFGNEGLVFGHALLVTLTAGVLMLAVYRRGAPAIWAWSAGIAMLMLDLPIVGTIRPQLFGQLGAALFLLACAEMPRRSHPLSWLPLVAVLWANLHGSIPMGLGILGLYAVGLTWDAYHQATGALSKVIHDRRLFVAWGAVLLVLAGSCLNPHGPALLIRILGFGDQAALASISEWRSLTPRSLTGVLMIASVAITALLVKYSPRKWETHEILMLAAFGLAVLPAIRMLAWWAIVWPWVVWPHAAAAWRKYQTEKTCEPIVDDDEPTAMRTMLAIGFAFMTILIAPPTFSMVSGRARGEGPILVTDTPLYVADEVVRRGLVGNIAAPMDWADFLIWKTDGQLKPLVYSHVHLVEPSTWRAYESVFRGDESWLQTLRNQQMQYVLVSRKQYPALTKHVLVEDRSGKGGVRVLYQDQRCILAEVLPQPQAKNNGNDLLAPPS